MPYNQDVRWHLWVRLRGFKSLSKLKLWSNFTVKIPCTLSMKKQYAPAGALLKNIRNTRKKILNNYIWIAKVPRPVLRHHPCKAVSLCYVYFVKTCVTWNFIPFHILETIFFYDCISRVNLDPVSWIPPLCLKLIPGKQPLSPPQVPKIPNIFQRTDQ